MAGAEDFYRLIKQAYDGADRAQQPVVRPNRTLLTFINSTEAVALQEEMTAQATGNPWPWIWGSTVAGPDGGDWIWSEMGPWE